MTDGVKKLQDEARLSSTHAADYSAECERLREQLVQTTRWACDAEQRALQYLCRAQAAERQLLGARHVEDIIGTIERQHRDGS